MHKKLTVDDIKYICKHMMGIDWEPEFIHPTNYGDKKHWENTLIMQQSILNIIGNCQSKLEIMYFLGIAYYIFKNAEKEWGMDWTYPPFYSSKPGPKYCDIEEQEGIHIGEPWWGFTGDWGNFGPSAMLVIPQYKSPEKEIHHDFGIFTASDNAGGPPWHFLAAIEIEGYGVHKTRREADNIRYSDLSYKVFLIREENTEPHNWFREIASYWQSLAFQEGEAE